MKIIHTGDWHIGKIINDFSMLEDQKYILNQFFKVIEEEKPDAVVITGDIYDRSIPPKEAVELLDKTLTRLIEEFSIPTLIVAGNHDSQERLSFGNKLLEHKKLFIEGMMTENIKKVTFTDDFGPIHFYLMPYAHPAVIRSLFQDDSITDHHQAVSYLVNKIKQDYKDDERNILLTHHYLISDSEEVITTDSERSLSIGGTEYVDVSLVKNFDYVALGHLHQPQKVKFEHVRYSGSLLKYSFSEVTHKKGVVVVEMKKKGEMSQRFIELQPKRDMRVIEGSLNTLISPNYYSQFNCEDYILAKLTDENDLYDPLSSLRAIYPNIMQIQRSNLLTNVSSVTKATGDFKKKSKLSLFEEFYDNIMSQALDEAKKKILEEVVDEVLKGDSE